MMTYKKNNLDIYDEKADEWWQSNSAFYELKNFNPPRFNYFDQKLSSWQNVKVLDIGCGGGLTSEFLAERGAQVCGIDLSKKSLEVARDHAKEKGLSIDYQHGKAEEIPYPDKSFDAAVCVDVLEHVEDLERVLSETHRILRPGGYFFFDTINKTFLSKVVMIWFLEHLLKKLPIGLHDWEKFIPPKILVNMLRTVGFSEIEIKGFDIRGKNSKSGELNVKINNNTSIIYIGAARST